MQDWKDILYESLEDKDVPKWIEQLNDKLI